MDNLVHWWLLGDAMQDNNLKATAMKLLHQYGPQGYEIPLVREHLPFPHSKGSQN